MYLSNWEGVRQSLRLEFVPETRQILDMKERKNRTLVRFSKKPQALTAGHVMSVCYLQGNFGSICCRFSHGSKIQQWQNKIRTGCKLSLAGKEEILNFIRREGSTNKTKPTEIAGSSMFNTWRSWRFDRFGNHHLVRRMTHWQTTRLSMFGSSKRTKIVRFIFSTPTQRAQSLPPSLAPAPDNIY